MSRSLMLLARALPEGSHGVSRQRAGALRATKRSTSALPAPRPCAFDTSQDLSDQLCAPDAALLTYGVPAGLEEPPITAA
jgi:hypothetical protein